MVEQWFFLPCRRRQGSQGRPNVDDYPNLHLQLATLDHTVRSQSTRAHVEDSARCLVNRNGVISHRLIQHHPSKLCDDLNVTTCCPVEGPFARSKGSPKRCRCAPQMLNSCVLECAVPQRLFGLSAKSTLSPSLQVSLCTARDIVCGVRSR